MTYTPIANSDTGLSARTAINGIGTGLDTHIGLSGSDVHGLGDISAQSASAVSITGVVNIDSGTITPLTNHTVLSGSDVHGLGDISLQSASAINISAGTITPLTNHANLIGANVHELGDLSLQSASAVNISAGTITPLTNHANLVGANAHELGDMSLQSASAIVIDGGTINNTTFYMDIESTDINITLENHNDIVLVSGSPTIFLPTAVGLTGKIYTVKNVSSGCVVIAASGSQLIDGDASKDLPAQYSSLQIVSDNDNWNII